MKTLFVTSALSLTATLLATGALASNIYGDFANQDLNSTDQSSYGVTHPAVTDCLSRERNASRSASHQVAHAYDDFLSGNPDSGPGERTAPSRGQPGQPLFAHAGFSCENQG